MAIFTQVPCCSVELWNCVLSRIEAAKHHDGTLIVCVGSKMTIVAPEGEFPLGEISDDDQIIRELSGQKLVGVRVVKAKPTIGL